MNARYEPTKRDLALLVIFLVTVAFGVVLTAGLPGTATFVADGDPDDENVTEPAYEQPAPEEGDEHFEIHSEDYYSEEELAEREQRDDKEPWVSYINPRDEWRNPDIGDGSGKICVTLLNERGDVVAGESVPNTNATMETGYELRWHSDADPFVVQFPLTEHYDGMPYDGDQFGTSDHVPQGDGYMDAHCLEFHNLADNETVEYGPVEIEGEYADGIEVVGYVQTEGDTWDTDVDPIEAAEPYEAVGGNWTMDANNSHGQVVAVLQLDPENVHEDYAIGTDDGESDDAADDATTADGSSNAVQALLLAVAAVGLFGRTVSGRR